MPVDKIRYFQDLGIKVAGGEIRLPIGKGGAVKWIINSINST